MVVYEVGSPARPLTDHEAAYEVGFRFNLFLYHQIMCLITIKMIQWFKSQELKGQFWTPLELNCIITREIKEMVFFVSDLITSFVSCLHVIHKLWYSFLSPREIHRRRQDRQIAQDRRADGSLSSKTFFFNYSSRKTSNKLQELNESFILRTWSRSKRVNKSCNTCIYDHL